MLRYQETSAQSAELLRQVLPMIARNGGAYHPTIYSLWYEFLAGINPALKRALDVRLQSSAPISNDESGEYYRRYIGARELQSAELLEESLRGLLAKIASVAEATGGKAAAYGQSLGEASRQLAANIDPDQLRHLVARLTEQTEAVRSAAEEMRQQADASKGEIDALKQQLAAAHVAGLTDALTQINNRRGLEQAVQHLQQERSGGLLGCAVLVLDIDHFKRVNDSYGHLLGDRVIKGVAKLLSATVKGRDIVARMGGEEFAVLLPDTGAENAMTVAEQVRATVARARIRRINSEEFIDKVTVSLGVACARAAEELEALIGRADEALYRAKNGGRDRVELAQ